MKMLGQQLDRFVMVGVKPDNTFEQINEQSFPGKWKVIVYYPKDFTFVCPTEIVGYDNLHGEFAKRDAELLIGSTDNEYCKIAWKLADMTLNNMKSWMFADTVRNMFRNENGEWTDGLINQLGAFNDLTGSAFRATYIVDPANVIQHMTINNTDVGRNPEETLRILDALQTGELCACNRPVGGSTL